MPISEKCEFPPCDNLGTLRTINVLGLGKRVVLNFVTNTIERRVGLMRLIMDSSIGWSLSCGLESLYPLTH